MADSYPLTPRPQVRSTDPGTVGYQAPARVVDQGAGIRPSDSNVRGLVEGLSALNPGLNQYVRTEQQKEATAFETQAATAHQVGTAQAERDNSGLPLDLNPAPDAGFEGTFKTVQGMAYRQGIVERAAQAARAQTVAEYGDAKNRPDFDIDQFIAQHRQTNLQGLDSDMAGAMGKHLDSLEGALRQDWDGIRLKRLDEVRESSISATLRNVITPDDTGNAVQKYQEQVLPVILGMGKTRKEGAQYLFTHLKNLSDQAHGLPEIFDGLMTTKDQAGMTVFDANPELQAHIERAKHMAQEQRDKFVFDAAQDGNLLWTKQLDERLAKDPYSVSFEDLTAQQGKAGVYTTNEHVMSEWDRILKLRAAKDSQNDLLGLAKHGMLYMAPEKDQKGVMNALTQPFVSGMQAAIQSGDTSGVAALTGGLIDAHRAGGATVGSEPVERMFKFVGTAPPPGDGPPPPIFKAAAEVWRALEAKPELRNMYFDENGRKVMGAYTDALNAQSEPNAAYKGAYAVISPEARAREEAFKKTPEFTDKLTKATKWVTGSSFWPRMLGGSGRPDNAGQVVSDAQTFALDFVKRNPAATDDQVQQATQDYTEKNFVLDKGTGVAVRVPQGYSSDVTKKAIEAYTSKLTTDLKLKDRESGWGITMVPDNVNQGTYRVSTAFNGQPVHFIQQAKMSDIIDQHRKDTLWLPEDAAILKNAQLAFAAGKPYADPGLQAAVAKARNLGVQPDVVKQIDQQQLTSARNTLAAMPKSNFDVDTANLYRNDRPQNDPRLTVGSAQRFLDSSNGSSTGLAASLITMGEAVRLRAYDDPASGAGKNIGMGYNLNANAAVAEKDLRSAGVPAERIPGVINGTESLSLEQAQRLTLVTTGRYEQTAQGQVESIHPGMWPKLQPQQRAVLTDIAYQTGNVGQFRKALTALVSGDLPGFQDASRVFYTNRDGVKVEDKRRNALRNAMLSGTSYWQAFLQRSGSQPSNQIDAVNLATPPQ